MRVLACWAIPQTATLVHVSRIGLQVGTYMAHANPLLLIDGRQPDGPGISFSLANFWAEVRLQPSAKLVFKPHPQHDSYEYDNMGQLKTKLDSCGFYGGIRLLQAMVKAFYEWCLQKRIDLPPDRNFTLSYSTNIPRQAGLSGSSAICCAGELSCAVPGCPCS